MAKHPLYLSRTLLVFIAGLLCGGQAGLAQNSGLELHANSKATASDVGLPTYPGATLSKDKDNGAAVDMGFSFGDSTFRLLAANYITTDSPDQVLAFYRKPLSKYGEVLECNDGKPVGSLAKTRSGLTCADDQNGKVEVNGHSDSMGRELRAGSPHQYRVVGIDKAEPKSTRFGLVYVQLPKDEDSDKKSK